MNKRLLFLLFTCLIFSQTATSQTMIEDGKVWISQLVGPTVDGDYALHICGDTILNNMNYKKAYYVDIGNDRYFGGFREVGNKVYFQEEQNPEILLYDFDLEIQDTFQLIIAPGAPSIDFVLESIQMETIQGIEMEVYNFANEQKWVRHIGSMDGLYYIGFGVAQALGSYAENGNILWCEEFFFSQSCNEYYQSIDECFTTSTADLNAYQELTYYPNPTSSTLTIDLEDLDQQGKLTISIWDLGKRRINHFQSTYSPRLEIDLTHFSKGVYFISLENSQGITIGTFKAVKM